jgi:hypothetical protein
MTQPSTPPNPDAVAKARADFVEWFVKRYPANSVMSNPARQAPEIFRIVQVYLDRYAAPSSETKPLEMRLYCPNCKAQHIDQPQPEKGWTNPPHRSHECQSCGCVWRPADVPTTGVETIKTKGTRDWI